MTSAAVLVDAFDRIKQIVHRSADGLDEDALAWRITPDSNSIGWLVWHLTRIQDDHLADVAGMDQMYVAGGWWERLGRPFELDDTGYGHTSVQVGSLRFASAQPLLDYHDAVHDQSIGFLETIADEALNRVVDISWDPPVTLGVRLVSVISDNLQHAGQAAFVGGVRT